jgi:hypothetical protein
VRRNRSAKHSAIRKSTRGGRSSRLRTSDGDDGGRD